jgi:hypothetical protein
MKMVKVKFLHDVSNARITAKEGDEVEVPEKDARDFVRASLATDPTGKIQAGIEQRQTARRKKVRAEKLASKKSAAAAASAEQPAKK